MNGLWHWDCHVASRKVVTPAGELVAPVLFGALDDRSRVACHVQWYWTENAENVAHGLSQAIQKRGLPRSGLSDNGSAMTAAEITEGLERLGVLHETTLAHSPYQNGKQENFWTQVEGRLLAMLEDVPDLTLAILNDITQAWVEQEYNRKLHSEIGEAPLARFLAGPDVSRPSPDSAALRLAFTRTEGRSQRRSDGTVSIDGRRFEIPNRYRHLERVAIRYPTWDLSLVHLVDERTEKVLCRLYPLDKERNASGLRRPLETLETNPELARVPPAKGLPPLLVQILAQQAATGPPPAPQGRRGRTVNKKLLSLYGLKWNPFAPDVPVEALHVPPRIDSFCWRVEQLAGEGGFALVTGLPGAGKSSTLRLLAERLSAQRDFQVGVLTRPQAGLADFYREMGDLFGVELHPHNRWGGSKVLRERWQSHIDASHSRPVLIVDEAQETLLAVLAELRLLSSTRLDSHILLTVVLAGDGRLLDRFRSDELLPLGSRMRVRLTMERATPEELQECLKHAMAKAGAAKLMTPELVSTLCDHAQGNYRALMIMAGELLAVPAQREARQIDEKLFLETFAAPPPADAKAAGRRR